MKRILVAAVALAAALVPAESALAGCMATVGLSSTPAGVSSGETWAVDVTVLQHGRTPMPDATPAVILRKEGSSATQRFPAEKTGKVGVYRADVTFPSSGRWSYAVYDGFPWKECARTHDFAAVSIGGGGGDSATLSGSVTSPWALGGGAAALLAAAALVLVVRRRQPPRTAVPAA